MLVLKKREGREQSPKQTEVLSKLLREVGEGGLVDGGRGGVTNSRVSEYTAAFRGIMVAQSKKDVVKGARESFKNRKKRTGLELSMGLVPPARWLGGW